MVWDYELPYLTPEQNDELNLIGYSGKNSKGEKTRRLDYLNSLGIGEFDITQTEWDNGDFCEAFIVVRCYLIQAVV